MIFRLAVNCYLFFGSLKINLRENFLKNWYSGEKMQRSVFHLRLNNYEIQVERMLDASLRTKAIAIISSHHPNGTIISLSDEAKRDGLRKGLKVSLARKMSHSVLLMPFNSSLYQKVQKYIYKIISSYSPIIEPEGIGKFYLDMTGSNTIFKSQIQAGYLISKDIKNKIGLKNHIGISNNKLISRISTATVPENLYKIEYGNEQNFLSPLQSTYLPTTQEIFVKKIIHFLFLDYIKNIQEIISIPNSAKIIFGNYYQQLASEAKGQDYSAVKPPKFTHNIVEQEVLREDTNDVYLLKTVVRELAETIGFKLRKRKKIAKSLIVEIHYTDGYRNSKKGELTSNYNQSIIDECIKLFDKANYRRNRIRTIIINASKLNDYAKQLNLFEPLSNSDYLLSKTLDKIRNRYGFGSIQSGDIFARNRKEI